MRRQGWPRTSMPCASDTASITLPSRLGAADWLQERVLVRVCWCLAAVAARGGAWRHCGGHDMLRRRLRHLRQQRRRHRQGGRLELGSIPGRAARAQAGARRPVEPECGEVFRGGVDGGGRDVTWDGRSPREIDLIISAPRLPELLTPHRRAHHVHAPAAVLIMLC